MNSQKGCSQQIQYELKNIKFNKSWRICAYNDMNQRQRKHGQMDPSQHCYVANTTDLPETD